jgi:thiol-disulfide isomerase/thioredoxin
MLKQFVGRAGVLAAPVPVLAFVAACSGTPAADAAPDARDPIVATTAAGREVQNTGPQQLLRFGTTRSPSAVRLFTASSLEAGTGDRVLVATKEGVLSVRSVREFALAPVEPGDPLIERLDEGGHIIDRIGTVRGTEAGLLGQLVNTGWTAPQQDGGAVFAWALETDVIRFDASGQLVWRSVRPPPVPVSPPVLIRENTTVRPAFSEVQHAIAAGPDGRLYVLSGANRDSLRLDVLDDRGVFVRSGWLPRDRDIFVDTRGRVSSVAPGCVLVSERITHPHIDIPALDGKGRVRLSDLEGKVVVVNVWASWCAPCRREMPALDTLAARLDSSRVAVLGLNDDANADDARRFVASLGGVRYLLAEGGGRLRAALGYRGLPYTVVLDRQHRIVTTIHGFGNSIELVRQAIDVALAEATRAGQ